MRYVTHAREFVIVRRVAKRLEMIHRRSTLALRIVLASLPLTLASCGGGGGGGGGGSPPPVAYTIGGTVTGLTGTGLSLRNDGGDPLTISANGVFTFATAIANGAG